MVKCQSCRKNDIELLSRWERCKNWLFHKLFPEDIADVAQNKYTQGFVDGLGRGRAVEREVMREIAKKYHNIDL